MTRWFEAVPLEHSTRASAVGYRIAARTRCVSMPRTWPLSAIGGPRCHRTVRSKGCLSNKTALAMIFKLAEAAEKSWRRLDGHNQLPKIILGVKFADGVEVIRSQAQAAAA